MELELEVVGEVEMLETAHQVAQAVMETAEDHLGLPVEDLTDHRPSVSDPANNRTSCSRPLCNERGSLSEM